MARTFLVRNAVFKEMICETFATDSLGNPVALRESKRLAGRVPLPAVHWMLYNRKPFTYRLSGEARDDDNQKRQQTLDEN